MGIKPDHISFLGVLFLIPVIIFFDSAPIIVIASLLLYVCMDGLDGALARNTGTASQAGALLDIVCDQLGMVVVATLYSGYGYADGWVCSCYIAAYLSMIVFAVVQNHYGIQMQFIFRSKYFCYCLYIVIALTPWGNIASLILMAFSIMHIISALQSFLRIRKYFLNGIK